MVGLGLYAPLRVDEFNHLLKEAHFLLLVFKLYPSKILNFKPAVLIRLIFRCIVDIMEANGKFHVYSVLRFKDGELKKKHTKGCQIRMS